MYLFKKIFSQFFMPVTASLLLLGTGLVLLWFSKKQRIGKILVSLVFFLFLILSFLPVSSVLLSPLENRYKPHLKADKQLEKHLQYIVVLSAGHTSDGDLPLTSQIGTASLVRLSEGIRLLKLYPGSFLLLSGGKTFDPVSEAQIMKRMALQFGVTPEKILMESDSVDTETQAEKIRDYVGKSSFLLVTSALHMPRSMALFQKKGMNPVAAPTAHVTKREKKVNPVLFFPNATSLRHVECAVHEYLGMVWSKIRGKI